MPESRFHGSRAALIQRLRALPAQLAGRSDPTGDTADMLTALGVELLSITRENYVVKARGGTDEAGVTWKPLSARYVAYKRRHPGLTGKRTAAAKKGRAGRPLLTNAQDKLWRGIFASTMRRLMNQGHSQAAAAGQAAALAWAMVKRAGGKTILGEYGGTSVEIGRDTGRLLASLSPGSSENILRTGRGEVTIGSNVEYALPFHMKRPILPDADSFPAVWWDRLAEVLGDACGRLVARSVGGY